ncbi:MAG: helix-hairpin-helix domain-containing protein [Sedimentisphaerales bacterium]|nr:helix-hairpin-helix domain-containing protein [Sedimentisphaerales bacterium]
MNEFGRNKIQSFAFIISVLIAFGLSCCFVWHLTGLERAVNANEILLDSKINPNHAPLASMARLPGIGPARAEAIITYRENYRIKNGNDRPFRNLDDLQKVNGIGTKIAQNMSNWLKFE